jgi:hypothetical protein
LKIDVTAVLAIYGSLLATIVFLWDVIKYICERTRLKVEVNHHILTGPGESKHRLGIKMANVGKGTITVVASGFRFSPPLPNGNMATIADPDLPVELNEGQSHTTYAEPSQIPQGQVICGWGRDATGRTWKSKKWPLRSKRSKK